MTHEDWMSMLAPLISAVVLAAAGIITVAASGLTKRVTAYLDVRGQAAQSTIVANASGLMQAAMANAAGQLALQVKTGELDITDTKQLATLARVQEQQIMAKLPGAVAQINPTLGAIAEGVLGKLTDKLGQSAIVLTTSVPALPGPNA